MKYSGHSSKRRKCFSKGYLVFHGEKASSADAFQGKCLNEGPLFHHKHIKPLHVP